MPAKFPLGQTVITPGALDKLSAASIKQSLDRHHAGDWGELCPEDIRTNECALVEGARLLSAYTSSSGIKFWIISEADRSVTTILLPNEY